jgi:tetratricopeptide (TPR) repeat protein
VLHRDIKAANIMLSGAGSEVFACITDFGLARAIDQDSTAFTAQGVPGTPGYVAPELYFGDPPSQASDVFAFGVVVYQMFTGSLPRSAVRDAKALGEVQVPGAPAPWRRMIASCLQPTPAARCKDIPSALRMVPGLADESLTRFVPVAAPSRSPLLSRRRLLALAGAAAAASGAGAWVEWDRIRLLFEPIPEQRFVALLAWPKVQATPVLSTVLDLLSQKLSRLEMTVKNFMLITPQDLPSEASPIDSPATSLQGLGANLVLAAAMEQTASEGRLNLSLLDAHTEKTLRKGSLSCPLAELGGIPQKAFGLAAMLLQLPAHDEKVSDEDQLKRVAPPVLQLYSEAQDLEDLPNSAGLKDAIAKYQKALELSPGFALANARLAIAYVRQFRLTHETANLDLAKRNADIAMSRNPESGTALFSRALVLLYTGKTAEAMTSFEQAQKADPGNPRIMVEKAEALLNTGRLKEAEQVYRDIIAQRPNFWPAYNNLGTALSRQARYQEAADAFDQAGMAAPAVALPMANLGTTYLQMGKNQDARNAMTESIRRAPNADAYLTLGDLDFEAKLYQSALNDYRHAAEIEPNYHLIHRNIGDCYAMLGDTSKEFESYQRAAEVLRKSLSANPQNGLDWANLAYYDAKIHNTQEAEKDIRNAETNGGTDVDSRFMLTQALAVSGRNEEALKMLLWCTDNGISTTGVDLALDLKQLRKDRRYLEHIRERGKNPQGGSTA